MKNNYSTRVLPALLLALGLSSNVAAQISLQTAPYAQDFNTLATTGTTNAKTTLPTGWDLLEVNAGTGTTADANYAASNGSLNSGNTYSFGADASTERAFGTLLSSSLTPAIGASFVNNTGTTLINLTVGYTGETWRIGGTTRADRLDFQYSLNATSLSTGTWVDVDALDYTNLASTTLAGNGVSTPLHTATMNATVSGLNIPVGATVWIRWNDFNAAGSDDGIGVDDFSLSWEGISPNAPALSVPATPLTFAAQLVNTASASQSYQLSAVNLTDNVTVTAPAGFQLSKDNAAFSSTLTFIPTELASAQTVYVRLLPTAAGTFSGNITHVTPGGITLTKAVFGTGFDPNNLLYTFDNCASAPTEGWTQFSVAGPQVWACTTFGHNAADATGKLNKPNGLQANGFANQASIVNEDWLISPALNTSSFTYPLLSFYSRVAFNGAPLRLKVSTNYSGTGDPAAAGVTWTDVAANFPEVGSDTWTLTDNIDLSAFKSATLYVAFVYSSSNEEAARWTLDDIRLRNSSTPPPAALFVNTASLAFGYRPNGSVITQTLNLTLRNLTADAMVTAAGAGFQVSKDGTTFSNSVSFAASESSATPKVITVRFSPTQGNTAYTGSLTIASAGVTSQMVDLTGNTYNVANTLEVVNWNIEWFGSAEAGQGPANKNLQQENVKTMLTSLNADVFALAEVVDTVRLGTIVRQLGGYKYSVSSAVSNGTFATSQKLVFVYRTSVIKNPTFSILLECPGQVTTCDSYTYWSSGRYPYAMEADVELNGATNRMMFVLIHAKANTAPTATSYERRKNAAAALKAKLDTDYPTSKFVILGDFNDDLDQTITTGLTTTESSYKAFVDDATNYQALTLPLSIAKKKSTASYNDVIDHAVASNELAANYLANSAEIQTGLAALIPNYANTTSDHYPVQTRYVFGTVTATKPVRLAQQLSISPNPVHNSLNLQLPTQVGELTLNVTAADGRVVFTGAGRAEQLSQQLSQRVGLLKAGLYMVRATSAQQTYFGRFVKQ
ncbi:T9SS-dependent choice-of-anchor J family protein [Hymenobacter wooponensis]|uniref:T9SS type A sorting domain-containing protein n=1 Tax=Hymenobacter wooponensis TaxID=1525360 RepID=A0A4Z0MJH7_9BACT|nr:choice-of-anchor J domain-containing protein [Hymenobacter wooponensis]TGD79704.1 T9SS type A sorting domain-containing protein [Hymenobacter wooponensis]